VPASATVNGVPLTVTRMVLLLLPARRASSPSVTEPAAAMRK
jgi:hypothetical protein